MALRGEDCGGAAGGQVFPALAQYDYTPVRGETLAYLLEEESNG